MLCQDLKDCIVAGIIESKQPAIITEQLQSGNQADQ